MAVSAGSYHPAAATSVHLGSVTSYELAHDSYELGVTELDAAAHAHARERHADAVEDPRDTFAAVRALDELVRLHAAAGRDMRELVRRHAEHVRDVDELVRLHAAAVRALGELVRRRLWV